MSFRVLHAYSSCASSPCNHHQLTTEFVLARPSYIKMFHNIVNSVSGVAPVPGSLYSDLPDVDKCLPVRPPLPLSGFSVCPDYPAFLHYVVYDDDVYGDTGEEQGRLPGLGTVMDRSIRTNTLGWSFVLAIFKIR